MALQPAEQQQMRGQCGSSTHSMRVSNHHASLILEGTDLDCSFDITTALTLPKPHFRIKAQDHGFRMVFSFSAALYVCPGGGLVCEGRAAGAVNLHPHLPS